MTHCRAVTEGGEVGSGVGGRLRGGGTVPAFGAPEDRTHASGHGSATAAGRPPADTGQPAWRGHTQGAEHSTKGLRPGQGMARTGVGGPCQTSGSSCLDGVHLLLTLKWPQRHWAGEGEGRGAHVVRGKSVPRGFYL